LTDGWLDLCRAAVEDVRFALAELPTRADREPVVGTGEGGDDTTAIDAAAESGIIRRFEAASLDGVLVSEERGEVRLGSGGDARFVIDPIDGSLNAKRGIGFFSLSIAVASGPTMADVDFGFVHDFGTEEEWTASRGEGAYLNGHLLDGARSRRLARRRSRRRRRRSSVSRTGCGSWAPWRSRSATSQRDAWTRSAR